ncbi:hypothetical protein D3C79_836880 [compost metagenome]
MPETEALLEQEHAGHQQQYRTKLHHQLRGARAEQVQAHQVQHIVADQPAGGQRHQAPTLAAQTVEPRQALACGQPGKQQAA